MPKTKIYFCVTDYTMANKLDVMDNCVYETSLEEWMKLTKKIFDNPSEYQVAEDDLGICLFASADKNKVYRVCESLFIPIEDTWPVSEGPEASAEKTVARIMAAEAEEGQNHTIKVA